MNVDPAGRHDLTLGVNRLAGGIGIVYFTNFTNCNNLAVSNSDITSVGWGAGSVYDGSVHDEKVVRHTELPEPCVGRSIGSELDWGRQDSVNLSDRISRSD